ncbi:MAG: hypothetical protein ACOC44_14665 [Promethearchaeia archaeon]
MVDEDLLRKMKAKFDEGPKAATLEDIPLLFDFSKQLIAENDIEKKIQIYYFFIHPYPQKYIVPL